MKQFISFDKSESVLSSIVKDLFSCGFLIFCIYISSDSIIWSIITVLIFLSFNFAIGYRILKVRTNEFNSLEEIQTWINNQK